MAVFSGQFKLRIDNEDQTTAMEPFEPPVFRIVDRGVADSQNPHQRHWWKHHSGYALAIFLYFAEYSTEVQRRDLKFFADYIASCLGADSRARRWDKKYLWQSFMTDDGTPIELSWDWGIQNDLPTIRYSIEPIGMHADTSLDPSNNFASAQFHQQLLGSEIECQNGWFNYFNAEFNRPTAQTAPFDSCYREHRGYSSHMFYAFDLNKEKIASKAYFFPELKARVNGVTNFEAIYHTIASAPHCTVQNTKALQVCNEFALESGREALEYDMLAIDLTEPRASRLKIYMRSRETNFNSVVDILTLGGRLQSFKRDQGIKDLWFLWNCLFQVNHQQEESLKFVDHRTAGILYNFEFKLGALIPTAKVYIPVRHYCRSDEQIIQGLATYLSYHQRDKYLPNYLKAMTALL
ncbi:hypothetical protein BGAL_0252g00030 [Botrytis galanthina]|uniref:Aromatic prenyltransferase (DMATS family) n=1 Tax=Botrytis galanthina TaxID=278940 RepID=A0A4S8QVB9_9HELO|nr:hypothetical protein BGAL_0252g00030 [Botrytis galanthina]